MISKASPVFPILLNTVREAVRQRFFNTLFLLALGLVATSWFFQQFNFGSGELKFILDFGYGALLFFGTLLAVVLPAQLWFSEMENRTAMTVLAKPVRRWEFLAGKLLGAWSILAIFSAVVALVIALIVYWRAALLAPRMDPEWVTGPLVLYHEIFLFAFAQTLKFFLIATFVILLGSFAQTQLYTIIVAFMLVVICHLQFLAVETYGPELMGWRAALFFLFSHLLPNFHLFNIGDALGLGPEPSPFGLAYMLKLSGISILYIFGYFGLAVFSFRKREL